MSPRAVAGYALERRLAAGSYGEVWFGRDRAGRAVALKLLHESVMRDTDSLRRFERESRAAISLRHPNLVAAIESGTAGGRAFLASEFVPGGSLQDLLDREGRLSLARALPIFADILRGLDAIHGAGMVHRDLKPANVLLDGQGGDGRAKIADLGLVRPTTAKRTLLTIEGEIVGTPAYMAPEQITHGGDVDIRADLYAFGVLCYRCLTGELPFAAEDVLGLLQAQIHQPTPDPSRLVAMPASLSTLVRQLMAKRREDRPRAPAVALGLIEHVIFEVRAEGAAHPATLADKVFATAVDLRNSSRTMPDVPSMAATVENEDEASALRLRDERGAFLFLYASSEVILGRDAAQGDSRRVCLRLLPAASNVEGSLRISGSHLALRRDAQKWCVRDLGSTHGTLLDGEQLSANPEHELRDGATLKLAGVLELRARYLPRAADAAHMAPSLSLERLNNGSHQRYLFVAAPVALDLSARPIGVGAGSWILASDNGSLRWLAAAPSTLAATPIQPDDPKV